MNITRRLVTPSTAGRVAIITLVLGLHAIDSHASAGSPLSHTNDGVDHPTLEGAHRFFYNGDYERAAAVTQKLCGSDAENLDACELRSASLLFQIKKALRETDVVDKSSAWSRCAACPGLMSAFLAETARDQRVARATLQAHPADEETLFFLGKVDLNYVWLQLGILGRKTGWDEYWEARRSLDDVLRMNPAHVRARVARGWMDYIVGTAVPRGVRWLLGGGNKKRGLLAVREVVARGSTDFFVQTEATFALWDMQVREHDVPEAVATARTLARDFPDNAELRAFLLEHESTARTIVSTSAMP